MEEELLIRRTIDVIAVAVAVAVVVVVKVYPPATLVRRGSVIETGRAVGAVRGRSGGKVIGARGLPGEGIEGATLGIGIGRVEAGVVGVGVGRAVAVAVD